MSALDPGLLLQARRVALEQTRPLVAVLEELSSLAPEDFAAALASLFHYPLMHMEGMHALTPAFDLLPYPDCMQRHIAVGLNAAGRCCLIIADPFDSGVENWAALRLGREFETFIAHRSDITAYLAQQEERMRAMQDMADTDGAETLDHALDDITLVRINEDTSPVVKLVNSTIYDALKLQASDIHLECDAGCLYIKYRIDGVMVQVGQVSGQDMAEQVVSRIKVMAELDIAERRVPQDGRFKVRVKGREIDFRVSVMPNIFGEDAVLRLLDRQSLT